MSDVRAGLLIGSLSGSSGSYSHALEAKSSHAAFVHRRRSLGRSLTTGVMLLPPQSVIESKSSSAACSVRSIVSPEMFAKDNMLTGWVRLRLKMGLLPMLAEQSVSSLRRGVMQSSYDADFSSIFVLGDSCCTCGWAARSGTDAPCGYAVCPLDAELSLLRNVGVAAPSSSSSPSKSRSSSSSSSSTGVLKCFATAADPSRKACLVTRDSPWANGNVAS
mmetsp:Transcript_54229/g.156712  ORF Transcript_54229/g.156712 Transcript_54229/m.156712 type:complete len:219 (-) Transcript_54229:1549-2205(-)